MELGVECIGGVRLEETRVQRSKKRLDASVDEVWVRGEWSGPENRVYNNRGDENSLIHCQPTLFKAVYDGGTPDQIVHVPVGHCLVPYNKIPKGQEDSVKAAMCRLSNVRCDSERFKMTFHPTRDR